MVSRYETETTPNPPEKINGNFAGKDILSMDQFDQVSLEILFDATEEMERLTTSGMKPNLLKGVIVALYFDEVSSRTRWSFDASSAKLGGKTISTGNPEQPCDIIDESFSRQIVSCMASSDIIVIRHPQTRAARTAVEISRSFKNSKTVPIINAGDGGEGEHPTQALLDLFTIKQHVGRLNNLKGIIARDLLYGRTVKSLIRGLALYPGNTLYLLSPEELRLPRKDFEDFSRRGIKLIEISQAEEIPKDADFWYWTRVQKERFTNQDDYERVKNKLVVTEELLEERGNPYMILMHPLPRVGEIDTRVDKDSRAVYLRSQIRNGMYVRMALLGLVLGKIDTD